MEGKVETPKRGKRGTPAPRKVDKMKRGLYEKPPSSMCPRCGSLNTESYATRKLGGEKIQYRRCLNPVCREEGEISKWKA